MTRKLFGTDGVRGRANDEPMTAAMALRLGQAAGRHFTNGDHGHRVVIGKDTRRSGYMLENALTAGFTSVGMNVFLVGPVPTPAVGFLTRSMRADLGVMISASHNPFEDNGIKFFGPDGFKLSDAAEEAIEARLEGEIALAEPRRIGRATRIEDGRGRYMEFAKTYYLKATSKYSALSPNFHSSVFLNGIQWCSAGVNPVRGHCLEPCSAPWLDQARTNRAYRSML